MVVETSCDGKREKYFKLRSLVDLKKKKKATDAWAQILALPLTSFLL